MNFRVLLTCAAASTLSLAAFAQHGSHLQGIEYYKANQPDNAKELLVRNYNSPENDKALASYYLGRIALDEGNQAEARKYFEQGIAANPECGYNYVGLGSLELKAKNVKAAEADFKTAEKYGKKDAELLIAIATAYYDADPVAYEKQYTKYDEKARRADLTNPTIYLFEGNIARDRDDIGMAASNYDMAISYDPTATGVYVNYANLYRKVNPRERINQLEKLVNANPNSAIGQKELAEAYYDYAEMLSEQGSNDQATSLYKKAADQYGKYVKNPNHFKRDEDRYALLLFSGGDYQDGYDYATLLLQQDPSNFSARRFQFFNAAQLPNFDKEQLLAMADNLFSQHKANPSVNKISAIDYNLGAEIYAENGKNDQAIALLQEGLSNPDLKNVNYFLKSIAANYIDLGQYDKAAQAYADYINKSEKATYAENLTAAIYAYYGAIEQSKTNPDESKSMYALAQKLAKQAAEMNPEQYRPIKVLGDIDKQLASSEAAARTAAVPMYVKSIALYEAKPDDSRKSDAIEMYNYMGNYYLDQKDTPTAKSFFVKAMELQPNDEAYRKFVNSLK